MECGLSVEVVESTAVPGGGTYPDVELASRALAISGAAPVAVLEEVLRRGDPPVVARVEDDKLLLDLRTVREEEDALLRERLIDLGPICERPEGVDG